MWRCQCDSLVTSKCTAFNRLLVKYLFLYNSCRNSGVC